MKLKIERITRKEIKTPNGKNPTAWTLGILCNDVWYSAFAADWNQEWKEGQVIEVDIKTNGKYNNIIPPKDAKAPDTKPSAKTITDGQVLDEMNNKLNQMQSEILGIKALIAEIHKIVSQAPAEDLPF